MILCLLLLRRMYISNEYPDLLNSTLLSLTKIDYTSNYYIHKSTVPKEYLGYYFYGTVNINGAKIRAVPKGNAVLDPLFCIDIKSVQDQYKIAVSVYPSIYVCVFNLICLIFIVFLTYSSHNANLPQMEMVYFCVLIAISYMAECIILYKKSIVTIEMLARLILPSVTVPNGNKIVGILPKNP